MPDLTQDWVEKIIFAAMPWIGIVGVMPWINILLQILLALIAVLIIHRIGTDILQRLAAPYPFSRRLVRYGHRAGRIVVFLVMLQVIWRNGADSLPGISILRHLNALALIAALTVLGIRFVKAIADTIIELNPAHAPDNLQARRIQTQTKVLSRTAMVLIILIGSGTALMTLPLLRQIGTSLLASAGAAGLVVGFAARPVLSNLLAGIQLALTQPIRLEDVVIVENEWGHVEEITGTYVVVRIWDQRRMVVPLQWFIEHPFQNWTRTNSEILGTVLIWADYRLPLDPVRKEAERICQTASEWDGRLCLTQVVETSQNAMQLRVLVSAGDAARSWDLRCRVREGLVHFIQRDYPEYLPRMRAEVISKGNEGSDAQTDPLAHR
ncbi:MAG: mechanosensitive ion channel [Herminiimonas sp.]|nr:mechanosensitive ion channel [Herminiimonas sp.]